MSLRMELDDLPPRYRDQARRQIEARGRRSKKKLAPAETGSLDFDSRGEQEYYMANILPRMQSGEIVKVTLHVAFLLLPEKIYGAVKLPKAEYTPDFLIEYADGSVEAVEIKSKFTRKQQRDYIYRRRLFIDLVAEPRGWKFTEVITADTAAEKKEWLALQAERKAKCVGK